MPLREAPNLSALIRAATLDAAKEHTAAIGEVMYAANRLHDRFFGVFAAIISLERNGEFGDEIRFYDHALAIWHIAQSDSMQRAMVMEAISTIPTSLFLKPAITRLEWAKKATDKLSAYRNIMAHNTIMFSGKFENKKLVWVPSIGGDGTRPAHRRRLEAIKSIRFWHSLRDDLIKLADYVDATHKQIQRLAAEQKGATLVGVPSSWPGRPRLLFLPRLEALEKSLSQGTRQTKRRTRHRSSRV